MNRFVLFLNDLFIDKKSEIFNENRLILLFPFILGCGICFYFDLNLEPNIIKTLIPTILFGFFCFFSKKINHILYILFLGFFVFSLGIFVAKIRCDSVSTKLLRKPIYAATIKGNVNHIENNQYKDQNIKITLNIKDIDYGKFLIGSNIKINASLEKNFIKNLDIGDIITAKVTLFPHAQKISKDSLDLRFLGFFNGISSTGNLIEVKKITKATKNNISNYIETLRKNLNEYFLKMFPKDIAAILMALTSGIKSYIDKNISNEFADAGIAHILAISGLHMMIVIGMFLGIFNLIFGFFLHIKKTKIISSILSLTMGCFYMVFSGLNYPVVRAFLMATFVLVGNILCRHPISTRSISIAAFIILLMFPESLFSVSFQLSFIAVLGIITLYESYGDKLELSFISKIKPIKYLFGILLTTFAATFATLPIIVQTFQRISLGAFFSNFIAIPLIGFWIMPSILCFLITAYIVRIDFLIDIFQKIVAFGTKILMKTAHIFASFPSKALTTTKPHYLFSASLFVSFMWILIVRGKPKLIAPMFAIYPIFSWITQKKPDIIVTKSLIAYRKDEILYVSNKNTFEIDNLIQTYNLDSFKKWEKPYITIDKYTLISKNLDEIDVNFNKNIKIITNQFLKGVLIDKFALIKNGNYFIYLTGDKVKNSENPNKKRPWIFN